MFRWRLNEGSPPHRRRPVVFVFLIGVRGARSRPIAGGACFGASGEYGFRNYFSHSFELFVSLPLTFLYNPPPPLRAARFRGRLQCRHHWRHDRRGCCIRLRHDVFRYVASAAQAGILEVSNWREALGRAAPMLLPVLHKDSIARIIWKFSF